MSQDHSRTSVATMQQGKPSSASVRDKSNSDLAAAIRSPENKAEIDALILERAYTVMNIGYVPDWTATEKANLANEFRKALRDHPIWAVENAFDSWIRTHARRPTPAEVNLLAIRETQTIRDEIAERQKQDALREQARLDEERNKPNPDVADAIMRAAGFTQAHTEAVYRSRCVQTRDQLAAIDYTSKREPHWSETVAPDSPQMEQLRRSRSENKLAIAAHAFQKHQG